MKPNENHVAMVPMLVGYRYTIDQSGTGFYLEPNLGLRYEHTFGSLGSDMFSFRISHAFTFGRRDQY